MIDIQKNLEDIKKRIEIACDKSGRNYDDVTLVAVTKTVDVDIINDSIGIGVRHIGENKVQEIERKHALIHGDVKLHMIGHLQSNKVKYIIDKVSLIHSLDRMSLAKEIEKRAKQSNIIAKVLIQVNIAEEETKFGLSKKEVIPFIEAMSKFEHIRIMGLMTMAPYDENSENIRFVFKELKELSEEIKDRKYDYIDMKYLSMGMTNDFEVAIEEGANLIRVGTGIYGRRTY